MIAAAYIDGTVRVWNVISGAEVKAFGPLDQGVEAIAFTAEGKGVFAAGLAGKIWLLNIAAGSAAAFDPAAGTAIKCLAVSPDGRYLAVGGDDKKARVWDTSSGKKVRELKNHEAPVTAVRFDEKSMLAAVGAEDGSVRVSGIPDGREVASFKTPTKAIIAFSFAPNGTLYAADANGTLRSFSLAEKKESTPRVLIPDVEQRLSKLEFAAFDAGSSSVIFGQGDGASSVFDLTGFKLTALLDSNKAALYGVAFSGDRRFMAAASRDNTIKLWDLVTGQALPQLAGHTAFVNAVIFDPDNRHLISSSYDGTIRIWDTAGIEKPVTLDGHKQPVVSLALTPDGNTLLSASQDGRVGVWDLTGRRPVGKFLPGHNGGVISVAVGRDGKLGASVGIDGTARIWNLETEAAISNPDPKAGELDSVAFSSDGKRIATGGIDGMIRFFDVETGREIAPPLAGHSGQVYSVAFSPDGKKLASSGFDGTVRTWTLVDNPVATTLEGHSGSVFQVSFPGGPDQLASAGQDGSVIMWDLATNSRALTLLTLRGDEWLVASPRGYFDGSYAARQQISWRFENNTFNSRPVEEFFSEFWFPGLLTEFLSSSKLPAERDISTKRRERPTVRISMPDVRAGAPSTDRKIRVRVEVGNAPAGAKDVRLFRNGTLVQKWPDDVLKGSSSITLETTVPIVAGDNRFVAYAFNSDDVKSLDDMVLVKGDASLARKGTMRILSMGVNVYTNTGFNLRYAVKDSREFTEELVRQQKALGTYDKFDIIPLTDEKATKKGILDAIASIAQRSEPEDALVLFYAGHGIADKNRFYMIPHDIAWDGRRADLDESVIPMIASGGISDEELERSVEKIGVNQILLIIDACNSGQAIETPDNRRGPMNSRGLAQLAYEKGMYVLTAAKGEQDAKENTRLQNGFLTYALVQNGLKEAKADVNGDGKIRVREWFNYAVDRVPQIDQEESQTPEGIARGVEKEKKRKAGQKVLDFQRPRVYYRREFEPEQMLIGTKLPG
jgi:WD40 repeat protein/uncharacterized caspase-like protein